MSRARRSLHLLLGIAVLLVAARIALPELVRAYANGVLDGTEGYEGRLGDVDLALWRGAYRVEDVRLDHREKQELRPLLRVRRLDLSLRWGALLRGALVGEVDATGVVYNVVAAPPDSDAALAQTGEEPALAERLSALFPFSIDRLVVREGELHFRDPYRSPRVDIALREVQLQARNWSNVGGRPGRYARARLRARAFRSARLAASLEADPLASPPEFVLAVAGRGIALLELNEFLRAYGGFDAEAGRLDVYAEVEADGGRFEGYVKPLVRSLDVLGEERNDEDWLDRLWEGGVGLVAEAFENQRVERQATRIPVEGEWGEATPDLFAALGNVLVNAFVEALPPGLEHPERFAPDPQGAR